MGEGGPELKKILVFKTLGIVVNFCLLCKSGTNLYVGKIVDYRNFVVYNDVGIGYIYIYI